MEREASGMPVPVDVTYERSYTATARRVFELLTEMGTSGDRIWPFASQPFMRSPGPLTPGTTEEWHLGVHAVLAAVEEQRAITWRIDNEGVDGTHGFTIESEGKRLTVRHRLAATLSDTEGRLFWKRLEDAHERAITGLFDKLGKVLKR